MWFSFVYDEAKSRVTQVWSYHLSYLHVMVPYHPNPSPLHAFHVPRPPDPSFPRANFGMPSHPWVSVSCNPNLFLLASGYSGVCACPPIQYILYKQYNFIILLYCTPYILKQCLASPLIPGLISPMSISGASCLRARIGNTLTIKVGSHKLSSDHCLANLLKSSIKTLAQIGPIPMPRSNPPQLTSAKA